MSSSGRSRTAQGVLAERAVLTDMDVLADRFAAGMLTPLMDLVVALVRRLLLSAALVVHEEAG